jgi:hypothetical protein
VAEETVARVALVLGVVVAGTVLALWSDWDPAGIVGFLGGIVGLGVALLAQLRATKEVHTMVNQQRTDAKAYQVVLETALREAGVKVPADQSLK